MGGGNTLSNFMAGFLGTLGGDIQDQRQKKLELQLQRIKDETSLLKDVLPNLPPNLQGMLFDKVMADYAQEGQLLDKGKKGKQPKGEGQGFGLHSLLSPLFGGGQKKQEQGQLTPVRSIQEPSMGQQIFGGQEAYQEQQFQKQLQRDKQIAAIKDQEAYESQQRQLDNYAKAINDDPSIPADQKSRLIAHAREVAFYPGKLPEQDKETLTQYKAQLLGRYLRGEITEADYKKSVAAVGEMEQAGQKQKAATEFDTWVESFTKSHGRPPNDKEIFGWHRQPKEETSASLDEIDAFAHDVSSRTIPLTQVPAKERGKVITYMKAHHIALPPQMPAATVDKLSQREAAIDNTISIINDIQQDMDLLQKLPTASLVDLAQSSGAIPGTLTRFLGVFQSQQQKMRIARLAGNMRSLQEHINVIRSPLGATGFRGKEGWQALQNQTVRALASPEVNKQTLDNTLAVLNRLKDATQGVINGSQEPNQGNSEGLTPIKLKLQSGKEIEIP